MFPIHCYRPYKLHGFSEHHCLNFQFSGMDSLCKTSKLACSVLRLRQTPEAVNLTHEIKYRRDVCFSQALTSLVIGLMNRLWCRPSNTEEDEHFIKICTNLGPLVCFESLLSVHKDEMTMFNDMIVVVEDLRNVEFNLILVDKRSKYKLKRNTSSQKSSPVVPMLEYHSFPLPRITGSRSSLKVSLTTVFEASTKKIKNS